MLKDSVYRAAVNDEVIMKYAEKLTLKHFADQDKHEYVRAKIRELGRLLSVLKAENNIQSIADAIHPCRFQAVLKSVRRVTGFVHMTGKYATPSLALKLGHALRKCATILKSKQLQEANKVMEKQADDFTQLCDIEWSSEISSLALKTLHDQKINKVTMMPITRDIVKLSSYLTKTAEGALAQLKCEETAEEDREYAWV